jgi:dihydrofolate synthase/folylpolyglutamate synthase
MPTLLDLPNWETSPPSSNPTATKFSLEPTRQLLARLGNPHQRVRFVHVAGSKGKGSVCQLLAVALQACGYRVGLYTSPHLHDLRERFQINGENIPATQFARLQAQHAPHWLAIPELSFFEACTALAIDWFAQEAVDIAILETGLGGRYDATNVVTPVLSLITSLELEHTAVLGDTLAEIAYAKGGIMKPAVPVLTVPQADSALQVLMQIACEQGAPFQVVAVPDSPPTSHSTRHQLNLALASAALHHLGTNGFHLPTPLYQPILAHTRLPARQEFLPGSPTYLLDVAHTIESAIDLRAFVLQLTIAKPFILLFGVMRDKQVQAVLQALRAMPITHCVLTSANHPRAMPVSALAPIATGLAFPNLFLTSQLSYGLPLAQQLAGKHGTILITGSFALVGPARTSLLLG